MVTVEVVGVCPVTVRVTERLPATVPGSRVGNGTLVLGVVTEMLAVAGLVPKPVPNPASPLLLAGNPEAVGLSATLNAPANVLAGLTVMVAFVMFEPGAWELGRPVRVNVGVTVLEPGRFVKAKEAGVARPATDAVTVYGPPDVALAVKAGEVATPEALVCTVAVMLGGVTANVPLAPDAGAVNVTLAPEIRLPLASFTVATNGRLKAAPTSALWPPPEVAVIVPGAPATLVRAKVAEPVTPVTEAATE
jgi:hypothetical protein